MYKYILDKNVILCGQFNLGQNVVIFMKSHIYDVFLIILPKGYNHPNCYNAYFSKNNKKAQYGFYCYFVLNIRTTPNPEICILLLLDG